MLEVLKLFNYAPPNFNITVDNITNKFGKTGTNIPFEIKRVGESYILYIKGEQWMMYDDNHSQAAQLFSHYYVANGDVITTGLGLAVRENWLLNNPNVKSLTILEKNEDLIEYHRQTNPHLFEKAKIIKCDAKIYKGTCDTLLIDHYEWESMDEIITDVSNICDNIKCEKMWFWHLETQILADIHKVNEDGICSRFRVNQFKIDAGSLKNIKQVYDSIKYKNKLSKLPNLTQEELQLIIAIYTLFFQVM